MSDFVHKVPFLRVLLPFITGIIFTPLIPEPAVEVYAGFMAICLLILLVVSRRADYGKEVTVGVLVTLFFFLAGITRICSIHRNNSFYDGEIFCATILEQPVEKVGSYRAEALLHPLGRGDPGSLKDEKLLIYFAKDSTPPCLEPGSLIIFKTRPQIIANRGNPYEFDYKKYLGRQSIYRQVYLAGGMWNRAGMDSVFRIRVLAERMRDRFLDIFSKHGISGDAYDVLAALTLGYKKSIDPEIRQVFASTGASHVLSVSGLHVGILYVVFNFCFGFMRKGRTLRLVFLTCAFVMLWGFAFLTGFSPPVQRSALMFSVVLIGDNLRRPANIFNTIALSAFILIAFNPLLIFDVGFQLSYLAVLGIVTFQPFIGNLLSPKTKVAGYFWDLSVVSVSAQMLTFPVSCYYFHQFPVYFWLANFMVIPMAFVLIVLAMLIFLTFPVTVLASFLAKVTILFLNLLLFFLQQIERIPGALLGGIGFSFVTLIFSFMMLAGLMLFIRTKKPGYFFTIVVISILFILGDSVGKYIDSKRRTLIAYNTREPVLHLINGRDNYLVASRKVLEESFPAWETAPVIRNFRLKRPVLIPLESDFEDEAVRKRSNALYFNGKIVVWADARSGVTNFNGADIIIFSGTLRNFKVIPAGIKPVYYGYLPATGDVTENVHYIRSMGAWSQDLPM